VPLPTLTPFAGELYSRTQPLAARDTENNFAWAVFCVALATMFDPYEFVRDTPQGPGYSSLLDIDRAPASGLGWLAMFAGVIDQYSLSDTGQRQLIDATAGFNRGTVAAIMSAAQSHLTGTRRVGLFERDGNDPYALRVVTYSAETPDPAQTAADIRAAKPIGLVLTVQVVAGQTWGDLVAEQASWASTQTTYATWQNVVDKIPI
jgi:hypothetical protein